MLLSSLVAPMFLKTSLLSLLGFGSSMAAIAQVDVDAVSRSASELTTAFFVGVIVPSCLYGLKTWIDSRTRHSSDGWGLYVSNMAQDKVNLIAEVKEKEKNIEVLNELLRKNDNEAVGLRAEVERLRERVRSLERRLREQGEPVTGDGLKD